MVKSSGLFDLFEGLAFGAAFDPELSQLASASKTVDTAATIASRCRRLLLRFMAGSSFPPLPSVARELSYKRPTPGDKLAERNGNCARRRENPRGWQPRACTHIR